MPLAPLEPAQRFATRRCYACYRKLDACFCAAIPRIDNQTNVLLVQHAHERFHPFNTARIVHQALSCSRLLRMYGDQSAEERDRLAAHLLPGAALLYPGRDAQPLPERPPAQLVIIDGTWHQAKVLVRDHPALSQLPRYALTPAAPSRYRIRREPTAEALSTLEATVAALRMFEPQTTGLDQLLAAFDAMIEGQLAHPKSATGWRRPRRRRRTTSKNIPTALLGDLAHVVVCYGESAPKEAGNGPGPLSWLAERLGTGERFHSLVRPGFELDDTLLGHLELTRGDFVAADELPDVRTAWNDFLRPDDVLAAYNPGVAGLLSQLSPGRECLILKSVELDAPRGATLEDQLRACSIARPAAELPARGGQRLANLAAWVRHLNAVGARSA